MHIEEKQLKDFILDSGLLSRAEVSEAEKEAQEKGESIATVLINKSRLSPDDVRRMQAHILGLSFVDLKNQTVPFDILCLVPEPVSRGHNIIAFRKVGDALEVALLDIEDFSHIDFLKNNSNLKMLPRLTDEESMKSAILQYQKGLKEKFGNQMQKDIASLKYIRDVLAESELDEEEIKKLTQDGGIARIVDTLIRHAVLQNASDIHIEPSADELLIRYRIGGALHEAMILPRNIGAGLSAQIKILAGLTPHQSRLPQDGRFTVDADGERISLRVLTLPTQYGEKIVLRFVRQNISGFTFESLGFHGENLDALYHALKRKDGMILVSGPFGSGKTTTLYTLLDIANRPDISISTIEDPIEYHIKRVNQTQVRSDIGLTFASGLRAILKRDPDIVMVGELGDADTALLATNAATHSHSVVTAVESESASGAIRKLLDMNVPTNLLASTLNIVIGQKLVRKLGENKEKYFLTKSELATLGRSVDLDKVLTALKEEKIVSKSVNWETVPFWRAKKSLSSEDGYSGRLGLQEVLKISSPIKDLILKSATADAIARQAEKEGMLTLAEDGIFKAVQGLTTIDEVLKTI